MATEKLEYIFDLLQGKNTLTPELKKIQDQAKKTQKTLDDLATKSAIAFAGFAATIATTVRSFSKFEDIGVQFEVLTGNVETAQKALQQLKNFSARTPFQFADIANAGKQLLGFGFAVKDLTPLLTNIGNVAAASGKSIDEISLIFGQVAAAGKLTGERLLQFQERAIPIGPAIAKTLGVAETAVKDLVTKGVVDFATFQKAFDSLSKEGGFAFGGLEKLSLTLSGKISTLKDNFSLLSADLGAYFAPTIKKVVDFLIEFIQTLRDNAPLVEMIAKVVAFGTVLSGTISVLSAVGSAIIGLSASFKILAASAATSSVAIKTALISTGIGALIVGLSILITDLALNWDERVKWMSSVWEKFVNFFVEKYNSIKKAFKEFSFGEQFADEIKRINEVFGTSFKEYEKAKNKIEANPIKLDNTPIDLSAKPLNLDFSNLDKQLNVIDEKIGKKDIKFNMTPIPPKKATFGELLDNAAKSFATNFKKGGVDKAFKGLATDTKKLAVSFGDEINKKFNDINFKGFFTDFAPSLVSSIKQGEEGAKRVISSLGSFLGEQLLGPVGKAVGPIIDLLSMSSDELRKSIDSFFQAIPKIVEQIINNIPVIQQAIIANIPGLIEAFTRLWVQYMTDPKIWVQIATTAIEAFIEAAPRAVSAYINGVKDGLKNGIIDAFKEAFDKLRDLFKKIFSFDGGGRGAVESFLGFDFPFIKFAKGGRVKGNARVRGDSEANDVVPALLSPDEIVIPRSVALGSPTGILNFLKSIGTLSPQRQMVENFKDIGISPVKRGLGSFVGSVVGGIISATESVASGLTGGITDLLGNTVTGGFSIPFISNYIEDATNQLYQLANQLSESSGLNQILDNLGLNQISQFQDIISSLLKIGLKPDIKSLIKDPFNYVGNLIKNNIGIFRDQFMGLMKPLPLALGGMPLGVGTTDSIPAMLTPKELVVDRTTTKQLQNFLDNQSNNFNNQMSEPIIVKTTAEINGQAFADIILELNRKNSRLIA